jgi:GNAT superfamily N-acetyltransferase
LAADDRQTVFETTAGPVAGAAIQDMTALYRLVYAEEPYNAGSPDDVAAFVERTSRQVLRPGFRLVRVSVAAACVGFAFGFTFPRDGWWRGEADPPPPEVLAEEKFAVIELVVHPGWRRRGIGRRLMELLLVGRPERYAVLTAVAAAPARAIYGRWGWWQVGTARHSPSQPVMDQLVLALPPTH